MSGPYASPLVWFFGQGRADGTAAMKDALGGKGAGLAEMTTLGIPTRSPTRFPTRFSMRFSRRTRTAVSRAKPW